MRGDGCAEVAGNCWCSGGVACKGLPPGRCDAFGGEGDTYYKPRVDDPNKCLRCEGQMKALILIVCACVGMFVLLMRGSKLMNTHYNSSVAVLVTEALKLPLSVALLCFEKGGVGAAWRRSSVFERAPPGDRPLFARAGCAHASAWR